MKSSISAVLFNGALALGLLLHMQTSPAAPAGNAAVEDTLIGTSPEGGRGVVVSPDGTRVAWVEMSGGRWTVAVDGKVRALFFAPQSHYLGYIITGAQIAEAGNSQIHTTQLVFNGTEYPGVASGSALFGADGGLAISPDGQRIAYVGSELATYGEVLDDKPRSALYINGEAAFESQWQVQEVIFSPDSKHYACVIESFKPSRKRDRNVVIDGKVGSDFEWVGKLVFAADGTLSFAARRDRPS